MYYVRIFLEAVRMSVLELGMMNGWFGSRFGATFKKTLLRK